MCKNHQEKVSIKIHPKTTLHDLTLLMIDNGCFDFYQEIIFYDGDVKVFEGFYDLVTVASILNDKNQQQFKDTPSKGKKKSKRGEGHKII